MTPSTPTCSDDKYTRRLQRIEKAISSISSDTRRSRIGYHLNSLQEDIQEMQESVSESLLDAKSAIEELKDFLEDDKQKEDGN